VEVEPLDTHKTVYSLGRIHGGDQQEFTYNMAKVATGLDKPTFAKYEQLLKGRRGVAIARMEGELCTACHIAMRPAVAARVRKNEELLTCDNCQRILYYVPPAAPEAAAEAPK